MIDPNLRENPYFFIKRAINLLNDRNGKIIVEIGCMRMDFTHPINECHHECCNDGHSSALWASTGLEFYTVDISPSSISVARKILIDQMKCENVHIYQQDGLEFLNNFTKPIDLLFLDAWDVENTEYAEKHLEAYNVAKNNIHDKTLILIDDTDVYWDFNKKDLFMSEDGLSGKGKLVIPEAQKDGFRIIFSGRQTLLAKGAV
ncbi:MAG: methyltransferase domain-containing protein [Bacillota bacterium]